MGMVINELDKNDRDDGDGRDKDTMETSEIGIASFGRGAFYTITLALNQELRALSCADGVIL